LKTHIFRQTFNLSD